MDGDLKPVGTQIGAQMRCILGCICDALEICSYSEWIWFENVGGKNRQSYRNGKGWGKKRMWEGMNDTVRDSVKIRRRRKVLRRFRVALWLTGCVSKRQ